MASDFSMGFEPADRLAQDRDSVRRRFWMKLKKVASRLPFTEDLLAAYYCAFDKETPRQHVCLTARGLARWSRSPAPPPTAPGPRVPLRTSGDSDRAPESGSRTPMADQKSPTTP